MARAVPRVIRDLALACEKRVGIEMVGRDTELDRTILEAIKDPLTHLIRNSVDHGIELPAEREAIGKPAEGTVLLRAFHEGGRFSRDRYLAALRQARVDAADFEREQRRAAQRRKMESIVREGGKLAADEVAPAYIFRREKVRAEWAVLPLEPLLAQVTVTDADVESYLKSNQARFSRPERRRIELIVVRGRDVAAPVSDADAEAYYKANPAEFDKPRRVRAAHVLVRVPPAGASDAENRSRRPGSRR